jgi:hypothetical protein
MPSPSGQTQGYRSSSSSLYRRPRGSRSSSSSLSQSLRGSRRRTRSRSRPHRGRRRCTTSPCRRHRATATTAGRASCLRGCAAAGAAADCASAGPCDVAGLAGCDIRASPRAAVVPRAGHWQSFPGAKERLSCRLPSCPRRPAAPAEELLGVRVVLQQHLRPEGWDTLRPGRLTRRVRLADPVARQGLCGRLCRAAATEACVLRRDLQGRRVWARRRLPCSNDQQWHGSPRPHRAHNRRSRPHGSFGASRPPGTRQAPRLRDVEALSLRASGF